MSHLLNDSDLTTCQAALAAASSDAMCARFARVMAAHPFLSIACAHTLLAAYQRATGELTGDVPWASVVAWTIANAPPSVSLLSGMISPFDPGPVSDPCFDSAAEAVGSRPLSSFDVTACQAAFAARGATDPRCTRIAKAMSKHPRVGKLVAQMVLERYEAFNGPVTTTAIDWTKILDWLLTNGPAMLQLILTLLALFGL